MIAKGINHLLKSTTNKLTDLIKKRISTAEGKETDQVKM